MSEDETSSHARSASRFFIIPLFVLGVVLQIAWAVAILITAYYMTVWLSGKLFG